MIRYGPTAEVTDSWRAASLNNEVSVWPNGTARIPAVVLCAGSARRASLAWPGPGSTAIPTVTAKAPVESSYVARSTVVQCCRSSTGQAFLPVADVQEAAGAIPIRVAVSRAGLALSRAVAGTW